MWKEIKHHEWDNGKGLKVRIRKEDRTRFWVIEHSTNVFYEWYPDEHFSSMTQALKFAHAYMKRHS